jgi:uncharacterized phage-like protein YoqJ
MNIVAGTGHRPPKLAYPRTLLVKEWVVEQLERLEPDRVISGMALGFDTILAMEALRMKIPLVAAVPFPQQPDRWAEIHQHRYFNMLDDADEVVLLGPKYSPELFQVRNMWMVDQCTHLLVVWNGSRGGTANCVRYAKNHVDEVQRTTPVLVEYLWE